MCLKMILIRCFLLQCPFGNLPNPLRLHSGIVWNGIPIICGGINELSEVQDSCYKYENDKWKRVKWSYDVTLQNNGLSRDLNPGPPAPKAGIIPLDHWAPYILLFLEAINIFRCYSIFFLFTRWLTRAVQGKNVKTMKCVSFFTKN